MESPDIKKRPVKGGRKCIWMQAGVVKKKYCPTDYQCVECRFDRIMNQAVQRNRQSIPAGGAPRAKTAGLVPWKDRLKSLPAAKRPCIHHMKHRIGFRSCTNEYRCGSCDFDQYFQDQYSVHAVVHQVDLVEVMGFRIPQGYYFHRGHTWMRIEADDSVRVGVDDFALRLMGPLDRIDAPLLGKLVEQGRPDMSAARGPHRAELLSPVSGIVTAINSRVREEGNLANRYPYSKGWIMQVRPDRLRHDLKDLMINRETNDYMDGQVRQLYAVIENTAGPLAADGGFLGDDIFGSMPQLGWERLIKTFLKN